MISSFIILTVGCTSSVQRKSKPCTGLLMAPTCRFAALIPDDNHSPNSHQTSHDKAKWLDLVPEPPKDDDVPKPYGNRGCNDDEKGTIHTGWTGFGPCSLEFTMAKAHRLKPALLKSPLKASRSPRSCQSPRL